MTRVTIEKEKLEKVLKALELSSVTVDSFGLQKEMQEAIAAIKQAIAAPTVQEPIGYLFQHEETGLTTVVDVQQVEWGFEKNNPRHQKIGPVYTPPPAQPATEESSAVQPAQPAAQEFVCSTGFCHYKAVPDALTSADIHKHIEYVAGWNDFRQAILEMMK